MVAVNRIEQGGGSPELRTERVRNDRIEQGSGSIALHTKRIRRNRVLFNSNSLTTVFTQPFVGDVFVSPAAATGAAATELMVYTDASVLDTSFDAALTTGLPDGWIVSGSALPTNQGVRLHAGSAANGMATLLGPTAISRGDFAVDVTLGGPQLSTDTFVAAALDLVIAATTIELRLLRLPDRSVLAVGTYVNGSSITSLGAIVVPDVTGELTLRLVRDGTYVWGFVCRRDAVGRYTQETQVAYYDALPTTAGTPRLRVANNGVFAGAFARFRRFTVRSHAAINNRLLLFKSDPEQHRILGQVPPAPITERGAATLRVFGPWGSLTSVGGFTYELPTPLSVFFDGTKSLDLYSDPAVHD